ncbi:hypothetical protein A2714_04500 [Candidatus Woesebacteria bacterium RIFCSPHIGHO2_01_FULL_38_9]|uniref:Glycosyltransferase 2-like domain-containing protein n=2 Tax=Candidatus Woeseibacteriota TaxID=1752722 RepID=A0A1F7XZW4_9BACT|nr:MAG: hypothetical protein A2714_04500 [Candidatus Woesebacteria bacterium RIFCSPHIGHO2_01_FULL_38_9]OGM58343.1 MAG: hypothetical protein A3A75_04920 [Candidatus Woesebacteria bacterium RIFCSPLOWO2_01_FULL_39_10]
MKKTKLSIVILSYNTKDLLRSCLLSLEKVSDEVSFEVIISDNGSADGSTQMVEKDFPWVKKIIRNKQNIGFAAGNNKARYFAHGEYILFLNSDTVVYKNTLKEMIYYMDKNLAVGASTCKLVLPNGEPDKDARRSFVTPWTGLVHLFLKLDKIFPNSRLFSQYWYGYISPDATHEVDSLQGAFFLTRKKILDDVGWFDEDYFLDAEDIDLSWRIKEKRWKIMYYPKVETLHVKGASKGKNNETKKKIPFKEKVKFRLSGVNSMELFVKKRVWNKYPLPLMLLVLFGIKALKIIRFVKLLITER